MAFDVGLELGDARFPVPGQNPRHRNIVPEFRNTANDTLIVPSRRLTKVYVLGSVGRQGGIPLESGMTVTRAIAQAGGVTRIADANSTQLIRTEDGKTKVYSVPVADILSDGDLSQDPLLKPGDMIVVPEGFF